MRLTLPIPPSPNRWKRNGFAQQAQKDEYRRECWMAAIQQEKPSAEPPERVVLAATFFVARNLRDPDNLMLKWTLDALRQKQAGAMRWREGLFDTKGYFVDDDPSRVRIVKVDQVKVAKVADERLVLTIEPAPSIAQQNEHSERGSQS